MNSCRDIPRWSRSGRPAGSTSKALITGHRPLDEINQAFDDLRASRGIRTVIDICDHARPWRGGLEG